MQITLTDRESDLMDILWERGASTVAEVQKELEDELAYTTVLSVLQTLERKGYVGHQEAGRAHLYRPLIERDAARRSALKHLTAKFFKGSLEQLLLHAVEENKLSDEGIKRIRSLLDEHKKKNQS